MSQILFQISLQAHSLADLHRQLGAVLGGSPGLAFLATCLGASNPPEAGGVILDTEPIKAEPAPEAVPAETDPPAPVAEAAPEKPKRTRKAKAAEPAAEAPAEPQEAPAEEQAPMSAAEASTVMAPAVRHVASWSEGGSTFHLTREEVIDIARTFIASHPQGKERGAAVIKGICSTLGYGKLSEVPDELMQDALDAINEAKA